MSSNSSWWYILVSFALMTNITYSFPGLTNSWADYTNPGEPYQGFTSFTAYKQQAVRNTLLAWPSAANLSFTEAADDTGDNGTIRIAQQ